VENAFVALVDVWNAVLQAIAVDVMMDIILAGLNALNAQTLVLLVPVQVFVHHVHPVILYITIIAICATLQDVLIVLVTINVLVVQERLY
jgi:hypothetical protein